MAAPQPFLAAGIPGLSFGLSLGRGLSIQLDPSDQTVTEEDSLNPEEDVLFTKNTTVPSAMLVVHLHAIHDLIMPTLETNEESYVYISMGVGATNKLTSLKLIQNKTMTTPVVFSEVKHIPFLVNPLPKERMNKLVVSVCACKAGEENSLSKSKHKLIGRHEVHLHKILKNVTMHIDGSLLNKKGNTVGQIEMECCAVYGAFGYGQSYQLKNSLHSAADLVKMSLLPRIPPQDQKYRGTLLKPQKLLHPKFIPLDCDPVEDLEPSSSESNEEALECPSFPLLKQQMQRINQLRSVLQKQTTRTKRITFLRKVLQDGGSYVGNNDFDDLSDDDGTDKQAPIPQALSLMMNATKFLSHAPGIVRRKSEPQSGPSLPTNSLNPSEAPAARQRSFSIAPDVQSRNVEAMRDNLYSNRRQSIAPTSN